LDRAKTDTGKQDAAEDTRAWFLCPKRSNVDLTLETSGELNGTVAQGEQRVIAATAHIIPWVEMRATLTDDDGARAHQLTSKTLDTEALRF